MKADEIDPRTSVVYAALEYLQKKTSHTSGFAIFREGLGKSCLPALRHGLALVRKNMKRFLGNKKPQLFTIDGGRK